MVRGIDSFKNWFQGYEEQYVIIGGTACDILMTNEELSFRATKDIDLVLIVEALNADFGRKFWEYVKQAGYEHRSKSSGMPQFYRFSHPLSDQYPAMRSEEHTSELQSRFDLVCRLLLEKKQTTNRSGDDGQSRPRGAEVGLRRLMDRPLDSRQRDGIDRGDTGLRPSGRRERAQPTAGQQ